MKRQLFQNNEFAPVSLRRNKNYRFSTIFLICVAAASTSTPAFSLAAASASATSPSKSPAPRIIQLQRPHVERSPAEALQHLADECRSSDGIGIDIDEFDVYGDFDKSTAESFLRKFEQEIATEFGKEDAIFMPSGGMAQSIALLIHDANTSNVEEKKNDDDDDDNDAKQLPRRRCFACHHTSHLLLHEQDAYRELLHMEPIVISTLDRASGIAIPPMMFSDVERSIDNSNCSPSTLILELPHREIGGKLTPWKDILQMRDYCREHNIRFHLDGARIFEATTGYNDISSNGSSMTTLQNLSSLFDSVYISFYKGLGGLSGAMLLGDKAFCDQARIWLRRFGGNVFTLLPYAVSGWSGYKRQWRLPRHALNHNKDFLSFEAKKQKLVRIIEALSIDSEISNVVTFDPATPETNMVHGYLRATVEECNAALDAVQQETHIRVLVRVRPILKEKDPSYEYGYRSRFEWAMGESNGSIPDDVFLQGWTEFAKQLCQIQSNAKK